MLADGGTADPRARKEGGGLEGAARDDDGRGVDLHGRRGAVPVHDARLHAARAPVFGEDALGARADEEARAGVGGVLEEGLHGRLLAALLAADEAVAAHARVLAGGVDVAREVAMRVAETLAGVDELFVRAVVRRRGGGHAGP